jgi:hypothetical protein
MNLLRNGEVISHMSGIDGRAEKLVEGFGHGMMDPALLAQLEQARSAT